MPHDIKNLGDTIPYPIDKEKITRENKDIKSSNINKHVVHKSISTKAPTKPPTTVGPLMHTGGHY